MVSRRPLSVTLPPSAVTREHTGDRRKCDRGEVLCHQAPVTKSASALGRGSTRYTGFPSHSTSRKAAGAVPWPPSAPAASRSASAIRNVPPGSS